MKKMNFYAITEDFSVIKLGKYESYSQADTASNQDNLLIFDEGVIRDIFDKTKSVMGSVFCLHLNGGFTEAPYKNLDEVLETKEGLFIDSETLLKFSNNLKKVLGAM